MEARFRRAGSCGKAEVKTMQKNQKIEGDQNIMLARMFASTRNQSNTNDLGFDTHRQAYSHLFLSHVIFGKM